jgi:DNA helicase II / ATP-dependent DNA helicase PcrA
MHRTIYSMPSASRIIISAAGGGKTTRVVELALGATDGVTALLTYTRGNIRELQKKVHERRACIPAHVEIQPWFTFLLREMARPYRGVMHDKRVDGIFWVEGKSDRFARTTDIRRFYFQDGRRIYSDKIAKFICECERRSDGAVLRRLKQRFARIVIDEVQDMAGYDLDLIELMLQARIEMTLVGDFRQATFATNNSSKNKAFAGSKVVDKFEKWKKTGLVDIDYEQHTFRCNQTIADLADKFFPYAPKTVSKNLDITGHDGIFVVMSGDVLAYVSRFAPRALRYSVKTQCDIHAPLNFGESKGMTFDRVLIFPHGPAAKWIKSGNIEDVVKSLSKMYVAVTRARFSVAFVFDGTVHAIGATRWDPSSSSAAIRAVGLADQD